MNTPLDRAVPARGPPRRIPQCATRLCPVHPSPSQANNKFLCPTRSGRIEYSRRFLLHQHRECTPRSGREFAAANTTFFPVEEADRFHHLSAVNRALEVGGHTARAVHHRIKAGPQLGLSAKMARVLTISGRADVINFEFFITAFDGKFLYETEQTTNHGNNGTISIFEWRFPGSHRPPTDQEGTLQAVSNMSADYRGGPE